MVWACWMWGWLILCFGPLTALIGPVCFCHHCHLGAALQCQYAQTDVPLNNTVADIQVEDKGEGLGIQYGSTSTDSIPSYSMWSLCDPAPFKTWTQSIPSPNNGSKISTRTAWTQAQWGRCTSRTDPSIHSSPPALLALAPSLWGH
jgi:hypothetical protein